jgi:hypothetical protein
VSVTEPARPAGHPAQTGPILLDPGGPADPTVAAHRVDEVDRPARRRTAFS